jgi:hypothetical protein
MSALASINVELRVDRDFGSNREQNLELYTHTMQDPTFIAFFRKHYEKTYIQQFSPSAREMSKMQFYNELVAFFNEKSGLNGVGDCQILIRRSDGSNYAYLNLDKESLEIINVLDYTPMVVLKNLGMAVDERIQKVMNWVDLQISSNQEIPFEIILGPHLPPEKQGDVAELNKQQDLFLLEGVIGTERPVTVILIDPSFNPNSGNDGAGPEGQIVSYLEDKLGVQFTQESYNIDGHEDLPVTEYAFGNCKIIYASINLYPEVLRTLGFSGALTRQSETAYSKYVRPCEGEDSLLVAQEHHERKKPF